MGIGWLGDIVSRLFSSVSGPSGPTGPLCIHDLTIAPVRTLAVTQSAVRTLGITPAAVRTLGITIEVCDAD